MTRQDALADMLQKDCDDYIAFLQAIPAQWILGVRPHLGTPGWASFHGPFSRRPSVVVVASLTWPKSAEYLQTNPCMSVNQKPAGDQQTQLRDTKAVGEGLSSIQASAPCHSRTHVRFIRRFLEGVGIRSAYLQNARLGVAYPWQGRQEPYRQPPDPTIEAPPAYLHLRALVGIELAPPGASILARSCDPMAAVGY